MSDLPVCPTKEQSALLLSKVWSYSSLKTFKTCPYDFYRTYCLKDRRDKPNTFFGSAMHKWAEDYLLGLNPNADEVFKEHKVPVLLRSDFDYCLDNIKNFLEHQVKMHEHFVEREFKFKVGKYDFIFIVDLMVIIDKTVYIYDYKSSRNTRYALDHAPQMGFYKNAIQKVYPDFDIVVQLIFPRCNKTVLLNDVYFDEAATIKTVEEVLACKDFQPSTHKFCSSCAFKLKECSIYNPIGN